MNSKCKMRSLDAEEVYGRNKLDVFRKRGALATTSEFYISQYGSGRQYRKLYGRARNKFAGTYYTRTLYSKGEAVIIGSENYWLSPDIENYLGLNGDEHFCVTGVQNRNCGIRLAMPYDSIDSIPNNGKPPERADDGILEVEYGYLPRSYVYDGEFRNKLDKLNKRGKLIETPYEFTTDGRSYSLEEGSKTESFLECKNKVYEYKGKFYAKIYRAIDKEDKERYDWFMVEPVQWWIDEESKLMITEEIVYGGIEFKDINMFMNKYLSKELNQIKERDEIEIKKKYEPSFWDKLSRKKNKLKALPEGTIEEKTFESNVEKLIYGNAREEEMERPQYLEEKIRQAAKTGAKKVAKTGKENKIAIEKTEEAQKVNPVEERVNNILDAQMNRDDEEMYPHNRHFTNPQAVRTDRTYYVKGQDGDIYPTRDANNGDYYIGPDGVLRPNRQKVDLSKTPYEPKPQERKTQEDVAISPVAHISKEKLLKKPEDDIDR